MSFAAFTISEMAYVEREVLRQPYPEIKYPSTIPVDTSAPDFAGSIEFKTIDQRGEPAALGGRSNDIPMAELSSTIGSQTVHTYALGYDYSLIELGQAQYLGQNGRTAALNLLVEKAQGTRSVIEQWTDKLAFIGDTNTASIKTGLLNDLTVPKEAASKSIADILAESSSEKAATDLLDFFRTYINKVYVDQMNTVLRPNVIVLPYGQFTAMEGTRIPNTAENLVNYITRNLRVEIVPSLHAKGIGDAGADRMMVYTKDARYVKMHMPKTFGFEAPGTSNNVVFQVAGMLRTAGTELRIPKSHLYVDGV